MGQTRANVAWCSPYSFMRLFPHSLHPPLSTPSVCGMRECGSKKRKKKKKDDILAVVADLHRPFVCGVAQRAAPKDTRPKPTASSVAIHTAQTFSSSVRRNLISYGWNSPPPRRAGQVNAPHTSPLFPPKEEKQKITTHLVPKSVYGGDVIVVIFNVGRKQLERWVPPVVCSRKEGREGERGWREWINNWAPPQRHK